MEESASHDGTQLRHPEPALIASSSSLRERTPAPSSRVSTTSETLTPGDQHDSLELSELHEIPTHTRRDSSPSTVSSGSIRVVTRRSTRSSQVTTRSREPTGRFRHIIKFWRRNVVLSVSQNQNRDHYALERTYLAHMRTSLAFSLLGVLIAQLFSLQHSHVHHPEFGFYKIGKPLGCICQGFAIYLALIAAFRFLKQQHALSTGKIYAGGWELLSIAFLTGAVVITLLVLVILISVRRDSGI